MISLPYTLNPKPGCECRSRGFAKRRRAGDRGARRCRRGSAASGPEAQPLFLLSESLHPETPISLN